MCARGGQTLCCRYGINTPTHRLPAKLGSQEFAPRLQRAPSAGFRAETRLMHRNCASFSRRSGIGAQAKSRRTPNVVARS